MTPTTLTLPRPVPTQALRPPKENIPQTLGERQRIRDLVIAYVEQKRATPPLPLSELRSHAEVLIMEHKLDPKHVDYIGVLINNELWKDTLATIPYDRRLLLLPKCLRIEEKCPARFTVQKLRFVLNSRCTGRSRTFGLCRFSG